jgi:hypothetical protein
MTVDPLSRGHLDAIDRVVLKISQIEPVASSGRS